MMMTHRQPATVRPAATMVANAPKYAQQLCIFVCTNNQTRTRTRRARNRLAFFSLSRVYIIYASVPLHAYLHCVGHRVQWVLCVNVIESKQMKTS